MSVVRAAAARGVLLLIGVSACGADAPRTDGAITRDSAGVRIVESPAPAWAPGHGWTVADTPSVDLAGADSVSGGLPRQIRTARFLGDGRIAVLDGQPADVRIFTSEGRLERVVGGGGEGPGRFRATAMLAIVRGDSLLVHDPVLRRISLFDSNGRFGRSIALGTLCPGGFFAPAGMLADGRLLLTCDELDVPFPGPEGTVSSDTVAVYLADPSGTVRDTVGRYPASESFGVAVSLPRGVVVAPAPRPFGRNASIVVTDSQFWIGFGDRFEVRMLSPTGRLQAIARARISPRSVTAQDISAFKVERRAMPLPDGFAGQIESALRASLDRAPYPPTMPFYGRIVGDGPGRLWLEEYRPRGTERPHWWVLDPAGRLLGLVALPWGFTPTDISRNALLGVWRSPEGAVRVRVYRLMGS